MIVIISFEVNQVDVIDVVRIEKLITFLRVMRDRFFFDPHYQDAFPLEMSAGSANR